MARYFGLLSELEVSPEYETLRNAAVELERSYIRKANGMLQTWITNISGQAFSIQAARDGEEESYISRVD